MARRRKQSSFADDVMDIAAALPWWGGVLLAVIAYFVLNNLAARPVVIAPDPAKAAPGVIFAMLRTLAVIGQFVLPFLLMIGTLGGVIRRAKRRGLIRSVPSGSAAAATHAIDGMSWREFEQLVGEAFRLHGFAVSEQGGAGPDAGVDLELRRDGELHLVQCKQWRAYKVGVDVVRAHYGVMAARGATGGFVVTSGRFTAEARRFADGRNLHLIEGEQLQQMIRKARDSIEPDGASRSAATPVTSSMAAPRAAAPEAAVADAASADTAERDTPSCPSCAQPMVLRTARRGAQVGGQFWGCAGFPRCRGTRAIT